MLLFLIIFLQQYAQPVFPGNLSPLRPHKQTSCATDVFITAARDGIAYQQQESRMNDLIRSYRQVNDTGILTLPVVVHIVQDDPYLITDQTIADAISDLNDAYSKSGAYAASTGVDTRIRFCLAKKDPEGGVTNGITRTTSYYGHDLNPVIEDARLKNLVQWPPDQYINIWFIKNMRLDLVPRFECGKWIRTISQGYATMPPGGTPLDGIVVAGFGYLLAHEMGHYLGLYHTWEGLNCRNNDCTQDGDRVCDTPPDASLSAAASCNSPFNSCSTDTLSGFTADVPDMINNFMDYGNESCQNSFTQGQKDRMRAAINTMRPGLLQDKCTPPCSATVQANFTRDNHYPLPGSTINFTNTSTGANTFEWLLNGTVVSTSANYTTSFAAPGKYKVTLKAFNGSCYSTYTHYVIVNCGVAARFYTDRRELAAKAPVYVDSVQFFNTSVNATSYTWYMRSSTGMPNQVVSTAANFKYVFTQPGNYFVRLIATNGSCSDTTSIFTIEVMDPTPDGAVYVSQAECVQETKVRVSFALCNFGYAPIAPGVPISFYDNDPRLPNANKIDTTIYLKDTLQGHCCAPLYHHVLNVGYKKLDRVFVVFNDAGNNLPVVLPNTNLIELTYGNNFGTISNFAFKVNATPATSILEWGDTVQLHAQASPGIVTGYTWSTPRDLSCTNCQSPVLIADSSIIKTVVATSRQGCTDTAVVDIQVPPYNDFSARITAVECTSVDSLFVRFILYNAFKRGVLPKGLPISFYNGNPRTGTAVLLPPVFTLTDTVRAKESTFETFIKGMNTGRIYAVVNDSGRGVPVALPNTILLEKSYANNISDTLYQPEVLVVQPADTTVIRKQPVPLNLLSTIYNPLSTAWITSNNSLLNCLTCISPVVIPYETSVVKVRTENRFGCMLQGSAQVKVYPPDFTVTILDTKCYTNTAALVTINICMNNAYDTTWAGIPVSFYDGDPANAGTRLLSPVFYTPQLAAGNCNTYTFRITAPTTGKLYAVVNDKGTNRQQVPAVAYAETDITNNTVDVSYTPFQVSIDPADTTIQRLTPVQLTPIAVGGIISSYAWDPSPFISCTSCATPVVTPEYSSQFRVFVRNEYACTDTAMAIVRTSASTHVFVPDAFTPNGDRKNDVLYVLAGQDVVTIKNFGIYNRWGQQVFQVQNVPPNTPAHGWTGLVNGKEAATGTYVYMLTIGLRNGSQENLKGTIVLIR